MTVPAQPKIYHIVHVDRLQSIINDGFIWCDSEIANRMSPGTTIGMSDIKRRRLAELTLSSHPDLYVGNCTPFYFCPRSIMLYLLHQGNHPELTYRGGQGPIVHLEADLLASVEWANRNNLRWAFTLSNAGAYYFEDRSSLTQLAELNWGAIGANQWSGNGVAATIKEGKQAEFLVENRFPWQLIERVGVISRTVQGQVSASLRSTGHHPRVELKPEWYY